MQNKIILALIFCAVFLSVLSFYISHFVSPVIVRNVRELELKLGSVQSELADLNTKIPYYIYAGGSQGYVIDFSNDASFYFLGDTGLSADLELIGDYHQPEAAFIPIGNIYTMEKSTAAFAASLIDASDYVVPTHYASLPELEESADSFLEELEKYDLRARFKEFEIGKREELLGIETEWLGHNHWFFEDPNGSSILIDPEFTYNPSFPTDYQIVDHFKEISIVLITNAHPDSISIPSIKRLGSAFDPIFITPYELGIWIKSKFPEYKIVAVDRGAKITQKELLKMGIKEEEAEKIGEMSINVVSASHSSSLFQEELLNEEQE